VKITKLQIEQIIREELEGIIAESQAGAGFRHMAPKAAKTGLLLWERDPDALSRTEADLAFAMAIATEEINKLADTKADSDSITAGIKLHTPRVVAKKLCERNGGTDCESYLTINPNKFPKGS